VEPLLRRMTLKSREEIDALVAEQAASPERRPGQRAMAFDITARVHGTDEAERQVRVSEAAFSSEPVTDPDVLETLYHEVGGHDWQGDGDVVELAVASGLYASKSEARRAISQGGYSINGTRIVAPEDAVPDAVAGRYLVLRAGR